MELPFTEPTGVNILHVDDDPGLVDLASECLPREDESFTVKTETDPTAVPGRLEDERVDCIVSDYEMPEIDGLELVERVQSVDASIPFILFTGRGSEAVAAEHSTAASTRTSRRRAVCRYTLCWRIVSARSSTRHEQPAKRRK
jgi:Response regulator containing CheY-like receiver, AAA-type ATPase, and DNA-binding domains